MTAGEIPARREVRLCAAADVPEGASKRVVLTHHCPIAVFRLSGKLYAIDDKCTHAAESLSQGQVEGESIFCPAHLGEFHIPTGRAMGFPATVDLRTYPLAVRDGDVFADVGHEP